MTDKQPGDYWKHRYGTFWLCLTPENQPVNLSHYTVAEHEDQTITVVEMVRGWTLTRGNWSHA
jgi:hypothetical protein